MAQCKAGFSSSQTAIPEATSQQVKYSFLKLQYICALLLAIQCERSVSLAISCIKIRYRVKCIPTISFSFPANLRSLKELTVEITMFNIALQQLLTVPGREINSQCCLFCFLQGYYTLDMRCEHTETNPGVLLQHMNRLKRLTSNSMACVCSAVSISNSDGFHAALNFRSSRTVVECFMTVTRCPLTN